MLRGFALAFVVMTFPLYGQREARLDSRPIAISICKLMENPLKYQGRMIVVSGEIEGAYPHGAALLSPDCRGGMAITSVPEDDSALSKRFKAAFVARLSLQDLEVHAIVEGVFHANVRDGYRRIRTLDIKRIDGLTLSGDTSFVDGQVGFQRRIIPDAIPTLPKQ